jgi:hypothetical protein
MCWTTNAPYGGKFHWQKYVKSLVPSWPRRVVNATNVPRTQPKLIFSKFKEDNSKKSLDLAAISTLHIIILIQKLENGNWKFHFFFPKFKRNNSVKNQWTTTKIPTWPAHSWCIHTCNFNLKQTEISSRGITLSTNYWTMIKFKLDLHNDMM